MSIHDYFQSHPELAPQLKAARESFSKQTENISFTAFVLNQKLIETEDYLAWAQVQFNLVILRDDYFQMTKPDMRLWSRWQEVYPWTSECLPVGEWDGVLFVGCLEKPVDFNPATPVCFALCSPLMLKTWSQNFLSRSTPAVESLFNLELKEDSQGSDENLEDSSSEASGSDNLLLEFQDTAPPTEGSFLVKIAAMTPPVPTSKSLPVEKLVTEVKSAPVQALSTVNSSVNSTVTLLKAQPKNSVPVQKEKTGQFLLSNLNSSNKNLAAELRTLCEPLVSNFEKYLILSVDTNEVEARPLIWSNGFNPGIANYGISLKIPSIFYIVAATYKPFHGPLCANDMNEKFFDDWNMSQTPGHATLVPLLQKDRLIGILLALGESNAYNNHVLRLVVKSAAEISQKVASQVQRSAA